WQDIARDPNDISKGLKNSDEMLKADSTGKDTWAKILGTPGYTIGTDTNGRYILTPAPYENPSDPHMIESPSPRNGIPGPSSANGTDPLNGHEYTVQNNSDLEYACIFPLLAGSERSCTMANNCLASCDCQDIMNDNPLCEPNPMDGNNKTLQVRAKAY